MSDHRLKNILGPGNLEGTFRWFWLDHPIGGHLKGTLVMFIGVGRLEGTLEGTLLTLVLLIGFHPIQGDIKGHRGDVHYIPLKQG